jgi:hypothetical protein
VASTLVHEHELVYIQSFRLTQPFLSLFLISLQGSDRLFF